MKGYVRKDGRVGIRNHVAVIHTVKCAEHVARKISDQIEGAQHFGYDSCYADPYGYRVVTELANHPNVASVLLVKLGCESLPVDKMIEEIKATGKEVELLIIQRDGGTLKTIEKGVKIVKNLVEKAKDTPTREIGLKDLIIGLECGASDATSGLSANPTSGYLSDKVIDAGGIVILSELPELLGTDSYLLQKASTPEVREQLKDSLERAHQLGINMQTFSISVGNEHSGLTTIEEKSLGALSKAGNREITGIIKSAERPTKSGLYILDKVGDVNSNQLTIYEESDMDGFATLIACGAHFIIFTTGCGSVAGSVVAPVVKVCGNPKTCKINTDDFDVDASGIILGTETVTDTGEKLVHLIEELCNGTLTKAEELGHEEFDIPRKFMRACDVKYI